MKVITNIFPWYVKSTNRELRVHLDVMDLAKQFPDLSFMRINDPTAFIAGNAMQLASALFDRTPAKRWLRNWYPASVLGSVNYVPESALTRSGADVFFAHEYFPVNIRSEVMPTVYETITVSDEVMSFYGLGEHSAELEQERAFELRRKEAHGHASTIINIRDPSSARRFGNLLPAIADKIRIVPPYLQYVEPVAEDFVREKHNSSTQLNLLFIGNDARRKGLPILISVLSALPEQLRARIRLTVISRFIDGPVDVSAFPCEVRAGIATETLLELIRDSHIFVLPTRADTFGVVLLEAMAAGCAVISSRRDPQDWILDDGRAGLLVEPTDPAEIADALIRLVAAETRLQLALNGRERFIQHFHHVVVGQGYRNLFEEAQAIWRREHNRNKQP